MADIVIKVEHLSKDYRFGVIGHGTLYRDLQSLAARWLGKSDPNSPVNASPAANHGALFKALNDVSFEVRQGEVLGVIGRNGAGKSTLLKIISRVTAPSRGEVLLRGRVASLLEVGTGFHPELTGRENVFLNGAILGMTKKEISRKFDQIVEFAEVEPFIDTPVKRYSSGMHVRLAFAVAAHLEPEILVVDEVLAVGDIQFQKKCLGKMQEVGKSGRTILFVSHNMEAVSALCTRALVLHQGEVAYTGDVQRAVATYRETVRSSGVSVDNCSDRGGSGGVRITGVRASAASGERGAPVAPMDPVQIDVEVEVEPRYRGRSISVGIGIDAACGKRLCTNVSSWENDEIVIEAGRGVVRCLVASAAFVPGSYLVSVAVQFQADTLDCAVHCAEFEVRSGQSGFFAARERDHGEMYLPCSFRVVSGSSLEAAP